MEHVFFYAFGVIAIASGLMLVISRNPVHSALYLIVTLFCLAGLFALLNAHFLAAIQILVYAGAIMVLFLFVIMLLNLKEVKSEFEKLSGFKILGVAAAVLLLAEVVYLLLYRDSSIGMQGTASSELIARQGNTKMIGELLFTDYLLPFEVTSILLIVALIGAVVLAKRKLEK